MHTAERRATAALWSIQGIGPLTLRAVQERAGPVGELLEKPVAAWASKVEWRADTYVHLMSAGTLAAAADRVEQRCKAHHARILFSGDPGFPSRLQKVHNGPALLFAFGPGTDAPPRRRLAIVGTRRINNDAAQRLEAIAAEAADFGLGIVSGAARGVDQAAHRGALAVEGETWAFLGSALDEIDFGQREITRAILKHGGTVFSEFPPGFRANKNSFKVRNRLISGSADAVLVFRAPPKSGALHTATYALEQGRPVLVTPGDPWNESAMGSNELLQQGLARPHLSLRDLVSAVGLDGALSSQKAVAIDLAQLSKLARHVLVLLGIGPADFEALLEALPETSSAELSAVLVELEVFGAVVHKGGRRYEKR